MLILKKIIDAEELRAMAAQTFGDMVKAVADVERGLIALDGELHSDLETLLLEKGSKQKDLWGINFYPDLGGDEFVEFDSMINVRPSQGNKSRGVDDKKTRERILAVVNKWVKR